MDVWDALLSDRPYRKAFSKEDALDHMRIQAGKHFDPEILKVFLEMLDEGEETPPIGKAAENGAQPASPHPLKMETI